MPRYPNFSKCRPTVSPGPFGAANRLMPVWRGSASGSVLATSEKTVALCALVMNILLPFTT